MIKVEVQTLVVFTPPAPSALVLTPATSEELHDSPGVYRVVPIWVGAPEASSLRYALSGQKAPRPITHELFTDAITALDASIVRVIIDDVIGKMFSAKLILKQYDREVVLDARPSDAIALALRQDAPIYMMDDVLERASFPFIVHNTFHEAIALKQFQSFLETVTPDDFNEWGASTLPLQESSSEESAAPGEE